MRKIMQLIGCLLLCFLLVSCVNETKRLEKADKPVLEFLGFPRNFDPNEDPVAKFLEKETGVKVLYDILPLEYSEDKLELILSNKEEIDIMKLPAELYHRYAQKGYFAELDELLERYGERVLEVNDQASWETAQIDGKTYGIPERAPKAFVGDAIGIREDVLEELGEPIPQTLDDFYRLLVRIKEETNYIPITGYQPIIHPISGAFGVNARWTYDDRVIHRLEKDGMKEYLAFMQKLYQEGLMDEHWPFNTHTIVRDKFVAGEAAMMASYGWGVSGRVVPSMQKNFGTDVALIMGLEGENGQKGAWIEATGVDFYIVIPKVSKNKKEAMVYLNEKLEPSLFKRMVLGDEGIHWEEKDNRIEPILPRFMEERHNADWFMTSSDPKAYEQYWEVRTRKNYYHGVTFEKMQEQMAYGEEDVTTMAPPLEKEALYGDKLRKMEREYLLKAIVSPDEVESFDNFILRWRQAGGKSLSHEYTKWYQSTQKER